MDHRASITGPSPDLLVVGAGVLGLTIAHRAVSRGWRVLVVEAGCVGAGASGGPVGALTPFAPRRWGPRSRWQMKGLMSLEAEAAALAEATGLAPGWKRTGRVQPLASAAARRAAEQDCAAARCVWPAGHGMTLDGRADGVDPDAAPFGVLFDRLSARVTPALWLAARRAALGARGRVREGCRAVALGDGGIRTEQGPIAAGRVVIAAGWQTPALALGAVAADGQKGQAALLGARLPGPLVAAPGLYVVPHGEATAVGSTRERRWDGPGTDDALERLIDRARAAVPALRGAPVLRRWAAVRSTGTELPVLRRLGPRTLAACGLQGIGFAVAHLVAASVIAALETGVIPESDRA